MNKNKAKVFSFKDNFNYIKANAYFEENGFLIVRGLSISNLLKT